MCGFIYSNFGEESIFKDISSSLVHRGPDSKKFYSNNNLNHNLSFYRLSIIDPSEKGNQPFIDDELITVSNCEIYNFKDIKQDLIDNGVKFISNSFAEVIHHGYKIYGNDIFKKMECMFEIFIYDIKKNIIIFCRDHVGIKPLYFYHRGDKLAVCSEFLTLYKLIDKNNFSNLSDKYLLNFIYTPFNSTNKTIQESIFKAEPGCFYIYDINKKKILNTRYWNLSFNKKNDKLSLDDKLDYFDELFNNAIQKHLISDVRIGSMLSGGVDSSLIAALSSKYTNNLNTYTIDIENSLSKDDLRSIESLKQLGITNTYISINYKEIMDNIDKSIKIFDDLSSSDGGFISNYFLLNKIKEFDPNLKVMLMGDGADEVFFGYNWFKILKVKQIPKFLKKRIHYYAYNRVVNFKSFLKNSDYSNNLDLKHDNFYDQMRSYEISKQLPNHYLPKVDRSTMYNSIEGRVPFLDKNVIEFACSLQNEDLIKDNITKYFLRKYSEKYLPLDISYKEKKGFGLSSKILMSQDIDKVRDIIMSEKSFSNKFFSKKYKNKLLSNNLKNQNNMFALNQEVILWRIFLADLWYSNLSND